MAGALEATGEPFASRALKLRGALRRGLRRGRLRNRGRARRATEEEAAAEIVREAGSRDRRGSRRFAGVAAAPRRRPDCGPRPGRAWSPSSLTGTVLPLPTDARRGADRPARRGLRERCTSTGSCAAASAPLRRCAKALPRRSFATAWRQPPRTRASLAGAPRGTSLRSTYSVDVLGEPEPVDNLEELDPTRYGVIVTRGHRRGLLLPEFGRASTPSFDQIAIAKQKAGIAARRAGAPRALRGRPPRPPAASRDAPR